MHDEIATGNAFSFGATAGGDGVNFAVYSKNACKVEPQRENPGRSIRGRAPVAVPPQERPCKLRGALNTSNRNDRWSLTRSASPELKS